MYFFNILEPHFICQKAIKVITREKEKLIHEINEYYNSSNKTLESSQKNYENNILLNDYIQLIRQLEDLEEFGIQEMKEIANERRWKGRCAF